MGKKKKSSLARRPPTETLNRIQPDSRLARLFFPPCFFFFPRQVRHFCKHSSLSGSARDFSLSANQMVPAAACVAPVCRGGAVRPRLKRRLHSAERGLFKPARAPDGRGLRRKTTPRVAGCAHICQSQSRLSGGSS